METTLLTGEDVTDLLDHSSLVAALAAAHERLARAEASQPVPVGVAVGAGGEADRPSVIPMTATDRELGVSVVKLLADAPGNRAAGQPAQRSTVALFDNATGACLALVDGRDLTRMRTAAVSALATRTLASDAATLGVVGAGALAVEHVIAHARVVGTKRVVVWSRSGRTQRAFAEAVREALGAGVDVQPARHPQEVVESCATVCTLTPSVEPYLEAAWLRAGHHINAVGSPPRPAYGEVRPDAMLGSDLVAVDSRGVALAESGNVRAAVDAGLDPGGLVELGEILAGRRPGRRSGAEITVFNSVGVGLQDLAASMLLLERARASGRGRRIRLRD